MIKCISLPAVRSFPGKQSGKTGSQAFSLIEVVLAMGVTSFALLGMVALIPMGLNTAHQAADATTESQIIQFARNGLETTSFNNLKVWTSTTNYFDNQGLPTTQNNPAQIYSVTYSIADVSMSTNGESAAKSILINTGANGNSTNAVNVRVTIVNRTVAGAAATNLFPIVVSNAGF